LRQIKCGADFVVWMQISEPLFYLGNNYGPEKEIERGEKEEEGSSLHLLGARVIYAAIQVHSCAYIYLIP